MSGLSDHQTSIGSRLSAWPPNSPIAILGAGVSGRAAERLLRATGRPAVLFDENRGDCQKGFGTTEASAFRAVVVSPGFRPMHPWILAAREAGCPVLGELDLAAAAWQGRLVAVTGTNGKSTVVKLVEAALREAGFRAHAVGNIGTPFSEIAAQPHTADDWAVCEVSSFQARYIQIFRPDVVLWTTFSEDHISWHGSLPEYYRAKRRLLESAAPGQAFVGPGVAEAGTLFGIPLEPKVKVVRRSPFSDAPQGLFSAPPQSRNFALVQAWWHQEGLPVEALVRAAQELGPLPHRLSLVDSVEGVRFWNDSKATNFEATRGALERFRHPVHWIGGGRSKGGDIQAFAAGIAPQVAAACLLGETARALEDVFRLAGVPVCVCSSIEEAVHLSWKDSVRDGVRDVLLSPGFGSQDQFAGFEERGRVFSEAVLKLKPLLAVGNAPSTS